MIYCPKCGSENNDDYESCLKCRRDLVKAKTGEKKDFNCLKCSWPVFSRWVFCPKCGTKLEIKCEKNKEHTEPLEQSPEPEIERKYFNEGGDFINPVGEKDKLSNGPKCPTCGSTNIQKITLLPKVGAAALVGIFSLGYLSKTFKCNSCGYKW